MVDNEWIEECIRAATNGLKPDPELQMDIAQEFRTHVEDTIEAARASGASEEESVERALKAFGDPEEVGRATLRANLGRMRMRSVVKWFTRLTLLPAAVLVVLVFLVYTMQSGSEIVFFGAFENSLNRMTWFGSGPLSRWLEERAMGPRFKPGVTDDEKALFNAEKKNLMPWAEDVLRRFPEDPVCYGFYATVFLTQRTVYPAHSERLASEPASLEEVIALLDRGERIDPDNAFYNYMKAYALIGQGADVVEDETNAYQVVTRDQAFERPAHRLILKDRKMVERALDEVRRGNGKPIYSSRIVEFYDRRQGMIHAPTTFAQEWRRVVVLVGMPYPDLSRMRHLTDGIAAYGRYLAEEGKRDEAIAVLKDAEILGPKLGAFTHSFIALLVAQRIRVTLLEEGALVYDELGLAAEAGTARAEAARERSMRDKARGRRADGAFQTNWDREAGLLLGYMLPAITNRPIPELVEAWRPLERVLFERQVMIVVLLVGFVALIWIAVGVAIRAIRSRTSETTAMLFFPGWNRLACVIALSVVVPLLLYYAYTRLTPFGGWEYAVNYATDRIILEMVLLGLTVFGIALTTSYWAIRARCVEAGMAVPERGTFRPGWFWRTVAVVCAVVLVAYALSWDDHDWRRKAGFVLGAGFLALALAWLLVTGWRVARLPQELAAFRLTLARSVVPILAMVIVLFGLVSHAYLRFAERRYVRLTQRPGWRIVSDEIEMTAYNDYRAHLTKLHQAIMPPTGAAETP